MDEHMAYAEWMDTLLSHGCACLEDLSIEEIELKMERMYQCDISQEFYGENI
jgi:hypothetical protein